MIKPEHVSPDYDPSEAELERLAIILGRVMGRMTAVTYHEKNGNGKLLNWLLGIISVLMCGGIAGQVVMYGKQQALEAKNDAQFAATEKQLDSIQKMVDVRFRGGLTGDNPASASP